MVRESGTRRQVTEAITVVRRAHRIRRADGFARAPILLH